LFSHFISFIFVSYYLFHFSSLAFHYIITLIRHIIDAIFFSSLFHFEPLSFMMPPMAMPPERAHYDDAAVYAAIEMHERA